MKPADLIMNATNKPYQIIHYYIFTNLFTLQILKNVPPIMEDAVRFAPIMMDHLSVHVTLATS